MSPLNKLLLALRYYATAAFFLEMADFMGVSKSSAHRIVHRVTDLLTLYSEQWIKMPTNEEEMRETERGNYFISRFPKVIGMIDGTHIKIYSTGAYSHT